MAKGWQGPTPERLALAERVAELRSEGLTHREVAERLGIARSYSHALTSDPDGSQARARKDSYAGTCVDCGAATSGSDGADAAPQRCARCQARLQHEERRWTADAVVDAIRRFAKVYGRPPISDEWIRADFDRGYPARTSVYRSNHKTQRGSPFASWADAIEAAGFERPHSGTRTYKGGNVSSERTSYVILREREDGSWESMGERNEPTQLSALNAALNGSEPEGRWVAVPGRFWRPRALRPKTVYDFVEDA